MEACDLLARYGESANILAGGTDLMVKVNRKLLSPGVLVYIGDAGMNYIKEEVNSLVIGSAVSLAQIASSKPIKERAPILAAAAQSIGSPAIRNKGTIGGNLVNASPAADTAVALLALGASVKLVSKAGERTVTCEDFFTGPGQTVRRPDELLVDVIIPFQPEGTRTGYRKLGRRRADTLSVVSAAVCLQLNGTICSGARIALGAVAPTPMLAKKAAEALVGRRLDAEDIGAAAEIAAEETSPTDDVRATAWYRRRATQASVKNLLEQAAG